MTKTVSKKRISGFTITELLVAVGIVGLLAAVAIPRYSSQLCRSETVEAESTIASLQAIISASIDETGVYPVDWDDLTRVAVIMSDSGPVSGSFANKMTLPNGKYRLSIEGPTATIYQITAERIDGCPDRDVRSCLDVSTGASDLNRGDGSTNAAAPICA